MGFIDDAVYEYVRITAIQGVLHTYNVIQCGEVQPEGKDNPTIIASTHSNMGIDAGINYLFNPYPQRKIVYWAKSTLFRNPMANFFLKAIGCVPVYRKSDDLTGENQGHTRLFSETCQSLAKGNIIGLFPEGTSYTLPHMVSFRLGMAQTIQEYLKADQTEKKLVQVVPVSITYLQPDLYRSLAIATYGKPIIFHQENKLNVEEITRIIQVQVQNISLHAPDWTVYNAARMAVRLLFSKAAIDLVDLVPITQDFIRIFTDLNTHPVIEKIIKKCCVYHQKLKATGTSDSAVKSERFLIIDEIMTLAMYVPLAMPALILFSPIIALILWLRHYELYKEAMGHLIGVPVMITLFPWIIIMVVILRLIFRLHIVFGLGIMIVALSMYNKVIDHIVDAVITIKSIVALKRCTKDELKALIQQRKDLFSDLIATILGQNNSHDLFSDFTKVDYSNLKTGEFATEKSVPSTAPAADHRWEPRKIEFKRSTYEQVMNSWKNIRQKVLAAQTSNESTEKKASHGHKRIWMHET